jgi:hypothetical protein
MLGRLRTLYLILNYKTAIIVAIAVVSTFVCRQLGLSADFPMAVVLTAVVFPIVFSISAAYQRRETALSQYANMKAHGQVVYLATRDWLGKSDPALLDELRQLLSTMFGATKEMLMAPTSEMRERENKVYGAFSDLSEFIRDRLRGGGLASGEVSRCNQYLSKALISFETIKHIYQYRTPISLRTFSDFFLVVLPLLYGPYFAFLGKDYPAMMVYVPPVIFSLVLVTLDNIQGHLENPFDQIGEDDIQMNVDAFIERLGGSRA